MKEAKDKAEELIEKMHGFTKDDCILNALTCVDREIKLLEKIELEFANVGYCSRSFKFVLKELASLKQVKQEILNRQ